MSETVEMIPVNRSLSDAVTAYQRTFDHPTHIPGSGSITDFPNISDWFEKLRLYENEATLPGPEYVPSTQYVLIEKATNQIIGMLSIRKRLNDYLLNLGGHIGYSIAPIERQKGYGTYMLQEALKITRQLGIDRVLITCDDDNFGSAKVIENNQGRLEDKRFNEASQKWIRRYWIENN